MKIILTLCFLLLVNPLFSGDWADLTNLAIKLDRLEKEAEETKQAITKIRQANLVQTRIAWYRQQEKCFAKWHKFNPQKSSAGITLDVYVAELIIKVKRLEQLFKEKDRKK